MQSAGNVDRSPISMTVSGLEGPPSASDRIKKLTLERCGPGTIGYLAPMLTALAEIHFVDCGTQCIPGAIKKLPSLRAVVFERCDIQIFPSYLIECSKLRRVAVVENSSPIVIGTAIGRMTQLESLTINKCMVDKLPETIGALTALTELSVNDNQVVTVAVDLFKDLNHLRVIRMSGNLFSSIPLVILETTSLQELDFSSNRIVAMPNNFHSLPQLRVLDLSRNKIHTISETFFRCLKLELFSIAHNPLRTLGRFPIHLKTLDLSACDLDPSLAHLLSYTSLTKVTVDLSRAATLAVHALAHSLVRSNQAVAKVEDNVIILWGNQIPINSAEFIEALSNEVVPAHLCAIQQRQPAWKLWDNALKKCNQDMDLPTLKEKIEKELDKDVSWEELLGHLIIWKSISTTGWTSTLRRYFWWL